jgi:hypothetical protein
MHDNACDVRQQAAMLGRHPVEGERDGASDVQPLRLAADAKADLIDMLDRCRGHLVADRIDEALQASGAVLTRISHRIRCIMAWILVTAR